MNSFQEKLYKSNIPVKPELSGDNFREIFGYMFAQSLSQYQWSPEATPSHMVTTYPIALQRAWEDVNAQDETWKWWNHAFETIPMDQIYEELLHKTVDLACQQNEWSHKNRTALHQYVKEFMHEMREPQQGIANATCQQAIMNYAELSIVNDGNSLMTMACELMIEQLPDKVTFDDAYCIDIWMSGMFDNYQTLYEETVNAIGPAYAPEASICRTLMESAVFEGASHNITLETPAGLAALQARMPRVVSGIMEQRCVELDAYSTFHDGEMGLYHFTGEAEQVYLDFYPEIREQFDKEAACFWQSKYGMVYSDRFSSDEIARGFMQLTPLVEQSFQYIAPLVQTMNLQERQTFLRAFTNEFSQNPANMAGALTKAFMRFDAEYEPTIETAAMFDECLTQAGQRDIEFASKYIHKIAAESIIQDALRRFETIVVEYAHTDKAVWEEFKAALLNNKVDVGNGYSYDGLYLMAEGCSQILDNDPNFREYCTEVTGYPPDTYKFWTEKVEFATSAHMQHGGYQFCSALATYCALGAANTFNGLTMEDRHTLAEAMENADMESYCSAALMFERACESLSDDARAALASTIQTEYELMELDDIERAQYD